MRNAGKERPTATLVRKNKARGIMTWYARLAYRGSGRVRHVSMRTVMKGEARSAMLSLLDSGEWDEEDISVPTMGRLVEAYMGDARNRRVKEGTLGSYRDAFAFLGRFNGRRLSELGRDEVADAFAEEYGGCRPSTWNHRRGVVSTLFRFASTRMDFPNSLASAIPRRRGPKAPKEFWTMAQIHEILEAAPSPELRLLWSLMAFSGLRIHEALACKPADVREGFLHVVGKGSKAARLPVPSMLAEELARLPCWSFQGVTKEKSRLALVKAAERFEGRANNHKLRHSFASNLIRGGANAKAVQRLMRHSGIQTTLDTYSHLLDDDLGEEAELLRNAK